MQSGPALDTAVRPGGGLKGSMEDNDPNADFEAWYAAEYPRLVSLLVVVSGNPDVARDAASEAFVRALQRWDRIGRLDYRTRWVRRVGINLVNRQWRQWRREQAAFSRHGVADPAPADDHLAELLDVMRCLSPRARIAIAFRYVLGFTEQETADAMGVTAGTVATTLHRARKRLARALADDVDLAQEGA